MRKNIRTILPAITHICILYIQIAQTWFCTRTFIQEKKNQINARKHLADSHYIRTQLPAISCFPFFFSTKHLCETHQGTKSQHAPCGYVCSPSHQINNTQIIYKVSEKKNTSTCSGWPASSGGATKTTVGGGALW